MGIKGGPNIPFDNLRILTDSRNPSSVSGTKSNSISFNSIGTIIGATVSGTGTTKGILFSSASDKINFTDLSTLNLTSNISIVAWIFPIGFGGNNSGRIYDKFKSSFPQNGFAFWIDNNIGTNAIAYGTGWTVSTSVARLNNQVSLNSWQHLAVVHSGSTVTFYKNGSAIGSSNSITAPSSGSGTSATIGNNASGTNNFDGKIASVRLYNSVLTAKQIRQLYDATKGRYLV